jgi:uncharacterized protein YlxW (UPF0749 family)
LNPVSAIRGRRALAAVAGLLAFLLTLAWSQQAENTRRAEGRRPELLALLSARQDRAARLSSQLAALQERIDALASRVGGAPAAALAARIARLGPAAGTSPVSGPGVVVELSDSSLADRRDRSDADFVIQDVDLQAVVNELWADGAEAVAINGQRVISTTAIRSAGAAVLVNYRVLVSPYRVWAVGDASALADRFGRSAVARRFRTWADVYRLGFSVAGKNRIDIPAFSGALRVRFARPAGKTA